MPECLGQVHQQAQLVWHQCVILHISLQTQDGKEGQGLVKDEFQAVMQWLMVPYMMKLIRQSDPADTDTLSGKSMGEIISEWSQKFQGCYACLENMRWQCSGTAKVTAAKKQEEKAKLLAQQEREAAMALAPTLAAAQKSFEHAEAQVRGNLALFNPGDATHMLEHWRDAQAAAEALRTASRQLWAVQGRMNQHNEAANAAAMQALQWRETAAQALLPWKPSVIPFLLSWDNCTSYSLYADSKQQTLLAIVPIIQVLSPCFQAPVTCQFCSS